MESHGAQHHNHFGRVPEPTEPPRESWRLVCPAFRGVGLVGCHAAQPHGGQHGKTGLSGGVAAPSSGAGGRRPHGTRHRPCLGISDQTVYDWRRQDRIDMGVEPGLTTVERAELVAARRRIRELEQELAIHRAAAELLKGTTSPKVDTRPSR